MNEKEMAVVAEARDVFRKFEQIHLAKPVPEDEVAAAELHGKVLTNRRMAERLEEILGEADRGESV